MLKATYDPTNKNADAFSMDNMVETATKKILTSAERTLLGNTSGTNTGDETTATIKTKLGITTLSGSNTGDQDLSGKQDVLVSGTNIKTVNSTSLLGSGNVAVQATLVSGTNIKTINSNSLLGSGNIAVQATLVSGTNIKTINSTTLLGSGDISLPTRTLYTATIPTTGWTGASAPYYIDITVTGIASTHTPKVDVVQSDTVATAQAQLTAWAKIDRIVTSTNSIRVHAYTTIPTTAIPIQLEVVA